MDRPSFLDVAIAIRDRVAPFAEHFGLPSVRSLVIRKKSGKGFVYLQILPKPKIDDEQISSDSPERINSANLANRLYQVSGISRDYLESDLVGAGIDYLVDSKWVGDKPQGGIICAYVAHQENSETWNLTIKQTIGNSSIAFN